MSRRYEMQLDVSGFNKDKKEAIIEAVQEEWDGFRDWDDSEVSEELHSTGEGCLTGGESEAEFAARMNDAIVKANGGPCTVKVVTTCLEYIPCEVYEFNGDKKETKDGAED